METGYRLDNTGRAIPRDIIKLFVCTYNGEEIFRAELFPAIAANPFLAFFTTATESGELVFSWTDDARPDTDRDQANHGRMRLALASALPLLAAAAVAAEICTGGAALGIRVRGPGNPGDAGRRHGEPRHAVGAAGN